MLKYTTFIYYLLLGSSDTFPVRVKGFAFLSHSTTRQSLPLVPSYNKLFYTTTTITNHASYRKRFTNPLRCATLGETAPKTTTYISNYVVDIHSITKQNEIWKLYREGDIEKRKEEQPYICLSGERMNSSNTIRIKVTQHVTPNGSKINDMEEDAYFLPVLGRILAQRLLAIETPSSSGSSTRLLSCCATEVCIDLPTLGESSTMDSTPTRTITTILPAENHPIDNPAVVFEDLLPNGTTKGYELVELVDIQGQALAAIPRNFIHNYNMLHRGIGVLVVQPELQLPITPTIQDFTNTKVYCHQRTWSKRIFPGLYDMFIGGVSAVDEPSHDTAKRELEEELGIPVDLSSLSPPLFQCTIRTSYNHCRVTVFFYQCTADTHITWQKEEVAWGDFIPYRMVERAGELSIRRLNHTENTIQFEGEVLPVVENFSTETFSIEQSSSTDMNNSVNPLSWNFVPDGLLVWKAWIAWISKQQKKE